MIIAKINVNGAIAHTVYRKVIPSGIIGAQVEFEYAEDVWIGLHKTVVFRGPVTKDVVTDADIVTIPPEVVEKPLYQLSVGVYGVDADGNLAIPTIWADLGFVLESANPSGDTTTDPSLPVWEQIKQIADDAKQQALSVRNDADSGAFDGADGHTPEYGVDYGTPEQISGIANQAAEILKPDVNQIKDYLAYLAPTIVCQSSGNAIALDDSSNRPFCGLNLYGKTTQDGIPTPDAPVELVSVGDGGSVSVTVCGKNLFADGKVYSGGLDASYGQINIGSPVESPVHRKGWAGVGIRVAVRPNNTYTVSSDITPCKYFTVTFYKEFESVGSNANAISFKEFANRNNATFTTPENCYCVVITSVSNVESDFTWSWWQLEHGSDATVYEPYEGQALSISTPNGLPGIPVSSGGNYTDSTGQQWICDEVDFGRGVYVQRVHKQILNGSEEWKDAGTAEGLSGVRPGVTITTDIIYETDTHKTGIVMCDKYPAVTVLDTWGGIKGVSVSNLRSALYFYDSDHNATIGTWKAYLSENPVTIMCLLVTPIETKIPEDELAAYAALHTNYPNTTIFSDTDAQMEVGYQADTKLYIDKQFEELRNAIVSLGGNI